MQAIKEPKFKVAVILAGQLRFWEQSSEFFKRFNNFDPNIQFDFFLSTWDDYENLSGCDFSFLSAYEFIGANILKKREVDYVKYPYLLKRVNELKNFYEIEQEVKYDCVVSTRPDLLILSGFLARIKYYLIHNRYTPRTLYISGTIKERFHIKDSEFPDIYNRGEFNFTMPDMYVIGHKDAVDIHANIFNDMYINGKQKNHGVHITPAEHIVNNKIITHNHGAFVGIIRFTHIDMLDEVITSGFIDELFSIEYAEGKEKIRIKKSMKKLEENFHLGAQAYSKNKILI